VSLYKTKNINDFVYSQGASVTQAPAEIQPLTTLQNEAIFWAFHFPNAFHLFPFAICKCPSLLMKPFKGTGGAFEVLLLF
jgi:hypothetical protein